MLGFLFFICWITLPAHTLILENQKKKKNHKSQQMLPGCDKNCPIHCLYEAVNI